VTVRPPAMEAGRSGCASARRANSPASVPWSSIRWREGGSWVP